MRVLYLAPPGLKPGQLSRYTFLDEEIRALAKAGVDAYVVGREGHPRLDTEHVHLWPLPPDSAQERVRTLGFLGRHLGHVPVGNLSDVRQCYRSVRIERFAAEIITQEGVSLIHSFFGRPHGLGGMLARAATSVPVVAGLRGSDVNVMAEHGYGLRLDPFFDRAIRRLLRRADVTVSVSEFLRCQAVELGANPEASRVILKGVRLDHFDAGRRATVVRETIGLGPAPVVLAVAGLVRIKGLHHALEALAGVRAAGHRFQFVACGEGPERAALEDLAARLGVSDCVSFQGKVSRGTIRDYFASADLFLHAALIEASGNAILEALASGLPVVCTDAGGPAEYVEDSRTGFVVPVGDVGAMATRIEQLLENPELRREMGASARRSAEARFSYDRMIGEILTLYGSLLGSLPRQRVVETEAETTHV